jgi:hypothetical protein
MEGVGLGLARNIVQRYALEPTRHKNKRPTLCGALPGELFAETTRRPVINTHSPCKFFIVSYHFSNFELNCLRV